MRGHSAIRLVLGVSCSSASPEGHKVLNSGKARQPRTLQFRRLFFAFTACSPTVGPFALPLSGWVLPLTEEWLFSSLNTRGSVLRLFGVVMVVMRLSVHGVICCKSQGRSGRCSW